MAHSMLIGSEPFLITFQMGWIGVRPRQGLIARSSSTAVWRRHAVGTLTDSGCPKDASAMAISTLYNDPSHLHEHWHCVTQDLPFVRRDREESVAFVRDSNKQRRLVRSEKAEVFGTIRLLPIVQPVSSPDKNGFDTGSVPKSGNARRMPIEHGTRPFRGLVHFGDPRSHFIDYLQSTLRNRQFCAHNELHRIGIRPDCREQGTIVSITHIANEIYLHTSMCPTGPTWMCSN